MKLTYILAAVASVALLWGCVPANPKAEASLRVAAGQQLTVPVARVNPDGRYEQLGSATAEYDGRTLVVTFVRQGSSRYLNVSACARRLDDGPEACTEWRRPRSSTSRYRYGHYNRTTTFRFDERDIRPPMCASDNSVSAYVRVRTSTTSTTSTRPRSSTR
ncbi:hypothetical protein ACFL26_00625 [Patescibacteria group bacterium]